MAKLYIDGAVTVAAQANKYLSRWQSKLVVGATSDQIVALADLIACLASFLQKWHKVPPQN